jgi:hypothetical protein
MSTEDLEGNRDALARVVLDWRWMARGELDSKPECALCGYVLGNVECETSCALCLADGSGIESDCGKTYYEWYDARDAALSHPWCCDTMRAPTVLAAAARMRDLLVRLLDIVEDELARRRGGSPTITESPTVTATISPGVEVTQTWGGFEERVLVWCVEAKAFAVVVSPSYVLEGGESLTNGWVALRMLGEPALRFATQEAGKLIRVDCHTCADTSCERNGPTGISRTTATPRYEECWKAPPARDALVAEIDDVLPRDRVVAEVARALGHLGAANATLIDSLARCRGVDAHREAEGEAERCSGFVLSATFALRRLVEYLTDEDADVAVERIGGC